LRAVKVGKVVKIINCYEFAVTNSGIALEESLLLTGKKEGNHVENPQCIHGFWQGAVI
jgi:hypothetical protein